ncbi:MAG: hypothetical protein AB1603_06840 [Chloroflexota bacterium]
MSQAKKVLKGIAASEDYKALAQAIETADYDTISRSYLQVTQLLEKAQEGILQTIQGLPRRNKDAEREKFRAAFMLSASTILPHWHSLDSQLKAQGIMEGEVFALGSKGDPLVRTPEGRVVVVSGSAAKEGAKAKFRVVTRGEKLDFGRAVELTPDYFYLLMTQDTRQQIGRTFDRVEEHLKGRPGRSPEGGLAAVSELLRELEGARELTAKLQAAERERLLGRLQGYRRRLLGECILKLALDFLSGEEEREVTGCCNGDEQLAARALSAPGLFRLQAHQTLKMHLLAGEEPRGYSQAIRNLEERLDSMDAALKLMEFKSGVEEVYPLVRRYLEKMDMVFERLQRKAMELARAMSEDRVCSAEDIGSAVKGAFSSTVLSSELRRAFRSAEDFHTLRGAVVKLRAMLGDGETMTAESAIRPYLSQKVATAFASAS